MPRTCFSPVLDQYGMHSHATAINMMRTYRRCILGNKSNRRAVGGVIQLEGRACHRHGDADLWRANVRGITK